MSLADISKEYNDKLEAMKKAQQACLDLLCKQRGEAFDKYYRDLAIKNGKGVLMPAKATDIVYQYADTDKKVYRMMVLVIKSYEDYQKATYASVEEHRSEGIVDGLLLGIQVLIPLFPIVSITSSSDILDTICTSRTHFI